MGLASARLEPGLPPAGDAGPTLALDLLYVVPSGRRHGHGRRLAEAVLVWGARHGCVRVDAPALPGDRATKSLFESLGLRARLLVLSAPLAGPPI